MTPHPPQVHLLAPTDQDAACETLVLAFDRDPVACYLYPDPVRRRIGMRQVFRLILQHSRDHGRIETVGQGQGGVAAWVQPDAVQIGLWQSLRSGLWTFPFTVGLPSTFRVLRFQRFLDQCHRECFTERAWYLLSLGIRPDHQGQGQGSALVRAGLAAGFATGLPCCLETATPENVRFYERHGFQVRGTRQLPGDKLQLWMMVAPRP